VIGLPDKASGGQKMMDAFYPIMQPDQVAETARYYDEVFVPLGQVAPAFNDETVARYQGYVDGMTAVQTDAQNLVPALSAALGMSEEQVQGFMSQQFPAMTQMLQGMPAMTEDLSQMVGMMDANVVIFEQVPAGLAHYEPLVRTMTDQVENYDKVNALPDFTLFTWFFVIPGVILVVLAIIGLVAGRQQTKVEAPEAPTGDRELQPV
jgi:hypothetical protein